MKQIYKKRLLNVARALRESKQPKAFTMHYYLHENNSKFRCGTPACALGHFAARPDLQKAFAIGKDGDFQCPDDLGQKYFGLTDDEWVELFGTRGCGEAKMAKQAAKYIERWVAKR